MPIPPPPYRWTAQLVSLLSTSRTPTPSVTSPKPRYTIMASATAACVNLTDTVLEFFKDNASALEVVTATDDTGIVQFRPNTIFQVDGSRLSDLPIGWFLSLLLEVCDNAVPGEGINKDLGLVAVLLAAKDGSGDAALQDLRKRRTIVGRAFEFFVTNTTTSDTPTSGMRRAALGDFKYPLLPLRLQMIQLAAGTPTHPPAATPSTPLPAVTLPPSTSILVKHGRGSDTNSETDDTGDNKGAIHSHASGLCPDFDIPKQVS